jgi:hypothetical protein
VANTLNLFRNGAVGFIDWLDGSRSSIDGVTYRNQEVFTILRVFRETS